MQLTNKSNLGVVYISLCIILWSLIPTLAKFAQNELDHHQYLFYSSIVSFLSILYLLLLMLTLIFILESFNPEYEFRLPFH